MSCRRDVGVKTTTAGNTAKVRVHIDISCSSRTSQNSSRILQVLVSMRHHAGDSNSALNTLDSEGNNQHAGSSNLRIRHGVFTAVEDANGNDNEREDRESHDVRIDLAVSEELRAENQALGPIEGDNAMGREEGESCSAIRGREEHSSTTHDYQSRGSRRLAVYFPIERSPRSQ
eukprot:IDg13757t1